MIIAAVVFLCATASVLVGSWAGQLAGMLLAGVLAVTVSVLTPLLLRTAAGGPAMEAVHGWRNVAIEMARSRRHQHSLALIRIEGGAAGSASRMDDAELRRRLRVVDEIWRQDDDLFVLLPEADALTVSALEARLRAELPGVVERVHTAVFPDDGITVGSLRSRLMAGGSPPPIDGQGGLEPLPWQPKTSSREQAS